MDGPDCDCAWGPARRRDRDGDLGVGWSPGKGRDGSYLANRGFLWVTGSSVLLRPPLSNSIAKTREPFSVLLAPEVWGAEFGVQSPGQDCRWEAHTCWKQAYAAFLGGSGERGEMVFGNHFFLAAGILKSATEPVICVPMARPLPLLSSLTPVHAYLYPLPLPNHWDLTLGLGLQETHSRFYLLWGVWSHPGRFGPVGS